jgi:hypothetical protein
MEEVSLRKLKADADLKELELATKRDEMVAIEDLSLSRRVENVTASLKPAILAMPSKQATRLVGIKDKRAITDVSRGRRRSFAGSSSTQRVPEGKMHTSCEAGVRTLASFANRGSLLYMHMFA